MDEANLRAALQEQQLMAGQRSGGFLGDALQAGGIIAGAALGGPKGAQAGGAAGAALGASDAGPVRHLRSVDAGDGAGRERACAGACRGRKPLPAADPDPDASCAACAGGVAAVDRRHPAAAAGDRREARAGSAAPPVPAVAPAGNAPAPTAAPRGKPAPARSSTVRGGPADHRARAHDAPAGRARHR